MIAVIFEVVLADGRKEDYLRVAGEIREILESVDGFVSVERFQSLSNPGKILSLSFFRDEDAVKAWRETAEHRKAQSLGRNAYFSDYRLRIASVIRDYGMESRDEAPKDSVEIHG